MKLVQQFIVLNILMTQSVFRQILLHLFQQKFFKNYLKVIFLYSNLFHRKYT